MATPRHRKKLVFETERAYQSVPDCDLGQGMNPFCCCRYDAPLYMKVTQKVRRKSDEKETNGEPKWFEDDIYEDVAIEKAYVGRVSRCAVRPRA